MKKIWINFSIDLSMFLCMSFLAVSGIIQKYVLPPARGTRRGLGPEEWGGWTRHDWGEVHFWVAAALVILLTVHIILHWSWIVCRFENLFRKRTEACNE